jgi:flagellar hook-associated protein 3 FlgL
MKTENGTVPEDQKQWYIYFRNVETLNKLSGEIQYADLGMGQDKDADGKIVEGTYFNNAIPGINILGYGVDEDGDPKNLALLMKKFDHVLSQVDSNGTVPDELGGNQRVIDLLGKFDDVCEFTLKGYTKIDTEAKFLTSNSETLESQTLNLNEQIVDLEQVDLADAITQFMWDYNCYNAALKIGTQLLSQSLLDYMA